MILLYATGCRVAVCTANFIGVDWLWKNNASFVQDFPRKNQCSPRGSDFETALLDYVEPYRSRGGLDVAALRDFDFSAAKAVLIPSVPGYHTGAAMHRYGHMRLRAVLSREPLPAKFAQAPIVAQFSSLGSISEKWLMDELRVSMAAHAPPRNGAPAMAAGATDASAALMSSASLPPLRIVWPTVESVRTSLEGWSAGCSLCCDEKNMKPMLQRYLHVWDGEGQRRHRAMPHIKSYLRAAPDGELAWCLITSANLSNSAWGQLQKGNTQLMIRHYEASRQACAHAYKRARWQLQRSALWRNICVHGSQSFVASVFLVIVARTLCSASQQMGVLFTPSHYARALQLLKSRNQENFTCTPQNPLVCSPKGELSSLPYFTSRDAQQTQRHAAAASSHSTAAASSPAAAAASSASALPAPPGVRLFLLPPVDASPIGAASSSGAAVSSAATGKRKVEDLTGDDEEAADDDDGRRSESVATSAAKRARLQGDPSTPASAAVSTQPIRPSPSATPPGAGAASPPIEHVVICPIPYNVQSRPYNFAKGMLTVHTDLCHRYRCSARRSLRSHAPFLFVSDSVSALCLSQTSRGCGTKTSWSVRISPELDTRRLLLLPRHGHADCVVPHSSPFSFWICPLRLCTLPVRGLSRQCAHECAQLIVVSFPEFDGGGLPTYGVPVTPFLCILHAHAFAADRDSSLFRIRNPR